MLFLRANFQFFIPNKVYRILQRTFDSIQLVKEFKYSWTEHTGLEMVSKE